MPLCSRLVETPLLAIYLGIGIALRLGVEVYVRFVKSDDGGPDTIGLVTAPQLSLSDPLGAMFALWTVPILAWPLLVPAVVWAAIQGGLRGAH